MELQEGFVERGFAFIHANNYLSCDDEQDCLSKLNYLYDTELEPDGPRNRAYLKLAWDRQTQQISISKNQSYFQTAQSNKDDGGKQRQFAIMNPSILDLPLMQTVITTNLNVINDYKPLFESNNLTFGLHFIQYSVEEGGASYSSPVGLHIDDEPLVFVHLINLSTHAWGGDNLIARLDTQEITHVIRLECPMDTILLNNNCYHAVTPLGSRHGLAVRNIILFTVEPHHTQISTEN